MEPRKPKKSKKPKSKMTKMPKNPVAPKTQVEAEVCKSMRVREVRVL